MTNTRRYHQLAAAAFMVVALAACGNKQAQGPGGAGMPPTAVGVVTVQPHAVGLTSELPGRLEATRVAQVRARVAGIVLKRTYAEGSDVKAGQQLFQIDPAQYQASLDSAKAQLARADPLDAARRARGLGTVGLERGCHGQLPLISAAVSRTARTILS